MPLSDAVRPLKSLFRRAEHAPLVVRQKPARLRLALQSAMVLIGLFAIYVTYELGRYDAGYDRQAVAQKRAELEVKIDHLEESNRQMRTQLAELDTIRVGRGREQAEVAKSMGELQAQVARQSQELAFYRGVVAQGAAPLGVKIEQLRIVAGARPQTFIVHVSLVRSGRADTAVTGTVDLTLDGTADGAPKSFDLPSLTAGKVHELRYNFRYLEHFEQELMVPLAFKPEQLSVQVESSRHDIAPLSQTFLWNVESSP